MTKRGIYNCAHCTTTVYSFMPHLEPPDEWRWEPTTGQWICPACQPDNLTVLGYCPHGINLDREFCPHGCRI